MKTIIAATVPMVQHYWLQYKNTNILWKNLNLISIYHNIKYQNIWVIFLPTLLDTSHVRRCVKEEEQSPAGLCGFATVSLASGHTHNVLSLSQKTKYWPGFVQSLFALLKEQQIKMEQQDSCN